MAKKIQSNQLSQIRIFRTTLRKFRATHSLRLFPWRKTKNPYFILVSEIMLQQTQADRVIEKYRSFIKTFPTPTVLSSARTDSVLKAWSGLGYNRRALYLKRAASEIVERFNGKFPRSAKELESLPGVGPYTARAIQAFAYNKPAVFIETNIRTVFLHHFFTERKESKSDKVSDVTLFPLIERTLDQRNPRAWYNLLMDYGAYLKKSGNTIHTQSKQYTKQSAFKGSRRELRGSVLKLLASSKQTTRAIKKQLPGSTHSYEDTLKTLEKEGFITKVGHYYQLNN